MNKYLKIIIYLLQIPLTFVYFLSFLFPRDKKIWVFGSWDGTVFCDNSKYFFLYTVNRNKEQKKIRGIWLSKNKKIVKALADKGYESYYNYSFKGIYYMLRAKWIVLDHTKCSLIFWLRGGAKTLQLYHGTPLKKIGYDVQSAKYNKITMPISNLLLPWLYFKKNTYVTAPSKFFLPIFASAFGIKDKEIFVGGSPRNDLFFNKILNYEIGIDRDIYNSICKKSKRSKILLYAPTFRESQGNLLDEGKINLVEFNKFLRLNNSYLIIKYHQAGEQTKHRELERIIFLPNDFDLYSILKYIDILINDYSSIFFDFLLLNKPIVFFPFDLNKYLSKDRELYFNYDDFTPGPKAYNFEELLKCIKYFLKGNDNFSEKRKRVRDLSSDFIKGDYSKRIYEFILKNSYS